MGSCKAAILLFVCLAVTLAVAEAKWTYGGGGWRNQEPQPTAVPTASSPKASEPNPNPNPNGGDQKPAASEEVSDEDALLAGSSLAPSHAPAEEEKNPNPDSEPEADPKQATNTWFQQTQQSGNARAHSESGAGAGGDPERPSHGAPVNQEEDEEEEENAKGEGQPKPASGVQQPLTGGGQRGQGLPRDEDSSLAGAGKDPLFRGGASPPALEDDHPFSFGNYPVAPQQPPQGQQQEQEPKEGQKGEGEGEEEDGEEGQGQQQDQQPLDGAVGGAGRVGAGAARSPPPGREGQVAGGMGARGATGDVAEDGVRANDDVENEENGGVGGKEGGGKEPGEAGEEGEGEGEGEGERAGTGIKGAGAGTGTEEETETETEADRETGGGAAGKAGRGGGVGGAGGEGEGAEEQVEDEMGEEEGATKQQQQQAQEQDQQGARGGRGGGGIGVPLVGGGATRAGQVANSSSVQMVRWCCVGPAEFEFCNGIVPSLSETGKEEWSCVMRSTPIECMDTIGEGAAELINLEAGLAYVAFVNKSMKAILAERLDDGEFYDAVAVVRKGRCVRSRHLAFGGLRRLRSCHGGYLSAAGWNLPLQYMIESNLEAPRNEEEFLENDVELVNDFFSATCAPGGEHTHAVLCSACQDADSCQAGDVYGGYPGAFRCLLDDRADVAFVKTAIVGKYAAGGKYAQPWASEPASNFRYLCPDGGCMEVNDNPAANNCTLGQVSANVIMTRNDISERHKQAIIRRLQAAGANRDWVSLFYENHNPHEYLLSGSARGLVAVPSLTRPYLGLAGEVAAQIRALNEMPPSVGSSTHAASSGTARWHCLVTLVAFLLATIFVQ